MRLSTGLFSAWQVLMNARPTLLVLGLVAIVGCLGCAAAAVSPSPSPVPTATPDPTLVPSPTPDPSPTPSPTPDLGYDPADLDRARGIVDKVLAFAGNIGTDGSQISYTLASSTLDKLYALAEQERSWAFGDARLTPAQRDALTEAISAVDALKMVLEGAEDESARAFLLGLTVLTYMSTWEADRIALS